MTVFPARASTLPVCRAASVNVASHRRLDAQNTQTLSIAMP
jgi:hypothetical protein